MSTSTKPAPPIRSQLRWWPRAAFLLCGCLAPLLLDTQAALAPDSFRFAVLGDRTGEAQPGVYEQVWKEVAAQHPAFIVSVGDTIQGNDDAAAGREWHEVDRLLRPYARFPLYLAPGNHDIWSVASQRLFEQHAKHLEHYGFDYRQAHFTILDTSRSDELAPEEMAFLESDLKAHAAQPLKIIVSHRPTWLINAAFQDTSFPLHRLAKRYGVKYVLAGHIHQILQVTLEGVTYLSMPSSGGHLRLSEAYADGWFFGYGLVEVHGNGVDFQIHELAAPHGQARVSKSADWGMAGLLNR